MFARCRVNGLFIRRIGFSLVEILIVTALSAMMIMCVSLILSRYFSGEKKGFDNLSLLQEEGRFLSFLKHDLRTIIIGGDDHIPAPEILTDGTGKTTTGFGFSKVDTADEFGRPVWVHVSYELEEGSQGLFSMCRTVGTKAARTRMLPNMISSFTVQLLGQDDSTPLSVEQFQEAKKIRISLVTSGGELLRINADFYSPFLPETHPKAPAAAWLSNFHYQPFDSKTGAYLYSASGKILEYNGTPIDSKENIIKDAEGIGLTGETNKIWGHR